MRNVRNAPRDGRTLGRLARRGGDWIDGGLALALGGLLGALAAHFEGQAHALTCPPPNDREFWYLERVAVESPSGGDVGGEVSFWVESGNLSAGKSGDSAVTDVLDRCDVLELEEEAP